MLSERPGVFVLNGRRMLLKVNALIDPRQSVPAIPAQLRQSHAQRLFPLESGQSPIEFVRRIELGKDAIPIAELTLVLGLAPTLIAAEEVHDQLVVADDPFPARAFAQLPRVDVDLGELQHDVGVLVVRTEKERRDERLGCWIVFALKVVAIRHVVELGGLVAGHLDRRQTLGEHLREWPPIGHRVIDQLRQLLVGPRIPSDAAVQVFVDVLLFGVLRTARLDVQTDVLPVAEAILLDGVQQVEFLASGPGVFGARQLHSAGRVLGKLFILFIEPKNCIQFNNLPLTDIYGHFYVDQFPRRLRNTAKKYISTIY